VRLLCHGHEASVVLELGYAVLVAVNSDGAAHCLFQNRFRVDTRYSGDPLVERLHRTIKPNRVSQYHVSNRGDVASGKSEIATAAALRAKLGTRPPGRPWPWLARLSSTVHEWPPFHQDRIPNGRWAARADIPRIGRQHLDTLEMLPSKNNGRRNLQRGRIATDWTRCKRRNRPDSHPELPRRA